ncbi:metal-sulfur cluster assembly factor [Lactobacillus delbrueckii subsp. bulgaricus]
MNEEKRALVNQVIGQLQTVIDPELLVNVVDLGLIYGVDIDDEGNCLVTMTLTTAGCPLNDYLNREICQAVSQLAAIRGGKSPAGPDGLLY